MMQTFKQGNKGLLGNTGNCNCFSGTAYLDAIGGCNCHPNASILPFPFGGSEAQQISWRNEYLGGGVQPDGMPYELPETGGVKAPPGMKWTPAGWVPINTKTGGPRSTTAAGDNTIFGFSPLVVLGAAAVGLWMLSSMDGKK